MLEAVGRCLRRIEGSYAFGIICADYPNALIAARKDSPLIIGYGQNGNVIASDVTAVIKYTRDVVYMDDGEIAVLTADSVDVFDDELLPVEKTHSLVDWDVSAAEKGGYAHFMAKAVSYTHLPQLYYFLLIYRYQKSIGKSITHPPPS